MSPHVFRSELQPRLIDSQICTHSVNLTEFFPTARCRRLLKPPGLRNCLCFGKPVQSGRQGGRRRAGRYFRGKQSKTRAKKYLKALCAVKKHVVTSLVGVIVFVTPFFKVSLNIFFFYCFITLKYALVEMNTNKSC